MKVILISTGILVLALITAAMTWRLVSRSRSAPCPWWALPLLENPYIGALAGAGTLLDRAGVEPGMRVLDVGSGPGRLTLPAAERVGPAGSVVALDVQPKMLRRLEQRLVERGIKNVEIVLGGAGQGKVESGGFDRAFLVTVLGEIVEKEKTLQEIHDLLKAGGLLSITEVLPDPHYLSRRAVRNLVEPRGFRLEASYGSWLAFTVNFRKQETSSDEDWGQTVGP